MKHKRNIVLGSIVGLLAVLLLARMCTGGADDGTGTDLPAAVEDGNEDQAEADVEPDGPGETDNQFIRTDSAPEVELRPIGEEQLILEIPVILEPRDKRRAAIEHFLYGRPPEPGFSTEVDMPLLVTVGGDLCGRLDIDLVDPEQGEVLRSRAGRELSRSVQILRDTNSWFHSQGDENAAQMLRSMLAADCPGGAWVVYTAEMSARLSGRYWSWALDVDQIAQDVSVWAAWGNETEVRARVVDAGVPEEAVNTICVETEITSDTVGDVLNALLEGRPGASGGTPEEEAALNLAKSAALSAAARTCPAIMWSRLWSEPTSSTAGTFNIGDDEDLLRGILEHELEDGDQ